LITNSLGFKDGSVRDVPLQTTGRRILLIGDSFTEGIGMPFEDSFAGLLDHAGKERPEKIKFLNADVASYSPSIYYKKIKYLLEKGLRFDEVVLFSDTSDVTDEATTYFCIDDDPKYRAHCGPAEGSMQSAARPVKPRFFEDRFAVTNRLRSISSSRFNSGLATDETRSTPTTPISPGRFRISTWNTAMIRSVSREAWRDRCKT
jgi:hypothetical protein